MTKLTDGKEYETVRAFGADRAIINMRGAFVFVDRVGVAGMFELSDQPARPGAELDAINALVKATEDVTEVTMTKS